MSVLNMDGIACKRNYKAGHTIVHAPALDT